METQPQLKPLPNPSSPNAVPPAAVPTGWAAKEIRSRFRSRVLWVVGLWLTFIFVTSCFVIPFSTFVHFVQGLSKDAAFRQWFARFWLFSWFFVVKGWHATEYALLVFLSTTALQNVTNGRYRKNIGVAFAFAVLFAASDEWHQTFVPGRDGCVRDFFIDSAGASVAAMLLLRRCGQAKEAKTFR